jgi:hypothetical protein
MNTRRKGYLFFLCIGIITSSILSLFVTWGQISLPKINPDDVRSGTNVPDEMSAMFVSLLSGLTLPVTGTSGRISSLGFPIPYWIATILVASSSVMILMNIYKLGNFPVLMLMSLYGVAAIIVVGAGTELGLNGKLSPTFSLACIGPIAGMVLAWYIDPPKT